MLRKILKMSGVKKLTKKEQGKIVGGHHCDPEEACCYWCKKGVLSVFVFPTEPCPPGGYTRIEACV